MVILYQPVSSSTGIEKYYTSVIDIVTDAPSFYVTIENKPCACNSDISVWENSIYIPNSKNDIIASVYYSINYRSFQEFETALVFLLKSKYVTPVFLKEVSTDLFKKSILNCGCQQYTIKGLPVIYGTEQIIFRDKSGYNIESII